MGLLRELIIGKMGEKKRLEEQSKIMQLREQQRLRQVEEQRVYSQQQKLDERKYQEQKH